MVKRVPGPKPIKHPKISLGDQKQPDQRIAELTDALMRERADAINVRRQAGEDRLKMAGYFKAEIVRELLPVIDNFERALKHVTPDVTSSDFLKGIQGIVKQFEKVLSDLGVERIKTVGEPFDPRYHEAVQMEDGNGSREVVSEELQAGYRIGDEVLRHAMVKVKLEA
jgi:molecular chaperone GrpE